MIRTFVDRLIGPCYTGLDRDRARLLVGLNLLVWGSLPLPLVLELIRGNPIGLGVSAILGLASALTLLLTRAGKLGMAEWVWVLGLNLVVNGATLATGGINAGLFSANAFQVVLAAVLLRAPGVAAVLGVAALTAALAPFVQPQWQLTPALLLVVWATVLCSLGVVVLALVGFTERRYDELIAKRRQLEQALDELQASNVSRDYVSSILGALRELIIVTRADGTIRSVSRSVISLGWTEHDLIGRRLDGLLRPKEGRVLERSRDAEMSRADGTRVPVLVSVGSLPDGEKVWAATDISQLAATTTALRQAHDRARAASAAKSSFLANMSHELRTPLNAIIGYAELLSDDSEDPEVRDDLQRINDAARSLLELINGVLDLSKVESGKVSLHQGYFEVESVLDPLITVMEPIVARRGITFEVVGEVDGAPIFTDAAKLRQVLLNLLSNAAKYTDEGGVELKVERWSRDRLPWIRFLVEDTGVGMPPDELETVFEPFTQARREEGETRQGTGLGLSICRAYVEMMGGQILAESAPGVGSTFVVELPAERLVALGPRTPSVPIPDEVDAMERILVIDDDPDFLEFVSRALLADGRQVIGIPDPHQALAWARRFRADLIIVDVSMPVLSGWAFTVRLRETRSKDTPVMVVSGRDEAEVASALGCAAFLHKPVGVRELQLRVEALIDATQGG